VKNIPVIGNGDIITPQAAKKMFDETGCAGVSIGRGAFLHPWIPGFSGTRLQFRQKMGTHGGGFPRADCFRPNPLSPSACGDAPASGFDD
jgi:hypothetical protein